MVKLSKICAWLAAVTLSLSAILVAVAPGSARAEPLASQRTELVDAHKLKPVRALPEATPVSYQPPELAATDRWNVHTRFSAHVSHRTVYVIVVAVILAVAVAGVTVAYSYSLHLLEPGGRP